MAKKELKKLVKNALTDGMFNENGGCFYIGDHEIKFTAVSSVTRDCVMGVRCKFGHFGMLTLWSDRFDVKGMIRVFTDFLWKMF